MPKIIVMNMGIEDMLGNGLNSTQNQLTEKSSQRNIWFANDGDVILTRYPISNELLLYVSNTLGFDSNSICIVTPIVETDSPQALNDDLLLQPNIILELKKIIAGEPNWMFFPCFYTPGVAELAFILGIDKSIGQQFALQSGIELLNRKTHFRRFAIGTGLPLAAGSVIYSKKNLKKAISQLLSITGTVIVKRDNGAASMGNITITTKDVLPLPGSCETLQANEDWDAITSRIWDQLTDKWNQVLVVESYLNAKQSFYLEYSIEDGGNFIFTNNGDIIFKNDSDSSSKQLFWVGLEIPSIISNSHLKFAVIKANQFVNFVSKMGYRGLLNIDCILTEDNKIIFNEVNGRWGGCSVMHVIGERLIDKHYQKNFHMFSRRKVGMPPFQEILQILKENGLMFDKKSKEGVIILSSGDSAYSVSEFLLLGKSRAKMAEIEYTLFTSIENYQLQKRQN